MEVEFERIKTGVQEVIEVIRCIQRSLKQQWRSMDELKKCFDFEIVNSADGLKWEVNARKIDWVRQH